MGSLISGTFRLFLSWPKLQSPDVTVCRMEPSVPRVPGRGLPPERARKQRLTDHLSQRQKEVHLQGCLPWEFRFSDGVPFAELLGRQPTEGSGQWLLTLGPGRPTRNTLWASHSTVSQTRQLQGGCWGPPIKGEGDAGWKPMCLQRQACLSLDVYPWEPSRIQNAEGIWQEAACLSANWEESSRPKGWQTIHKLLRGVPWRPGMGEKDRETARQAQDGAASRRRESPARRVSR